MAGCLSSDILHTTETTERLDEGDGQVTSISDMSECSSQEGM
jgi:hypothetical protein